VNSPSSKRWIKTTWVSPKVKLPSDRHLTSPRKVL
jgi:hypothetical protein